MADDRFSIGSGVDLTGVDPGLLGAVRKASSSLPPGWRAEMTSGERKGDPRFHGQGKALDVQLIDAQGNRLPNYQSAENFRPYEQFAQAVHAAQPADTAPIRWGGYFGGPKGTYGAVDLMHFDTGNVPMGGGSWEGGLTDAQRKLFPGAQSVGFGTTMNAASTPVAGALAQQEVGPESVGGAAPASDGPHVHAARSCSNAGRCRHGEQQSALNIKYYKGAEKDYAGLDRALREYRSGRSANEVRSARGGWNSVRRTALEDLNKQNGMRAARRRPTRSSSSARAAGRLAITGACSANVAASQDAGIGPDDDIGFGRARTRRPSSCARWITQDRKARRRRSYRSTENGIAASIGGNAPAAGAPAGSPTAVATAPASTTAKPDDRSWWDKLTGSPVDANGNPTGKNSPLQDLSQASIARLGAEGQTERQEAPERGMQLQAPPAHVPTGPSQAYGMTLNSFSTPLQWSSNARALPGLTQAGLQGGPVAAPGVSLNSLLPSSQGLGYGIDDVGYGYG